MKTLYKAKFSNPDTIIVLFKQSSLLDVSKTLVDELSQELTAVTQWFEDTIEDERRPFADAP